MEKVQQQLYDFEDEYLESTQITGNIVRGWEGYIDLKPNRYMNAKKEKKYKASERVFSFSSVSSPISATDIARETERMNSVVLRLKPAKDQGGVDGGSRKRGAEFAVPRPARKKKKDD